MEKKGNLIDFECGIGIGIRQALVFQKMLIYKNFHAKLCIRFAEKGPENIQ